MLTFLAVAVAAPFLVSGIATAAAQTQWLVVLAAGAAALSFTVARIGAFSRLSYADIPIAVAIAVLSPGAAALVASAARVAVSISQRHELDRALRGLGAAAFSAGSAGALFHLIRSLDPTRPVLAATAIAVLWYILVDQAQLALLVRTLRRRPYHGTTVEWWVTVAGSRALLVSPVAAAATYAPNDPLIILAVAPFATIAAIVLNGRFVSERRLRVLELTARFAQSIGRALDSAEVMRGLEQHLREIMDTEVISIAEVDRTRGIVRFRSIVSGGTERGPAERPFGDGLTDHVISTGIHLLMHDVPHEQAMLGITQRANLHGLQSASAVIVPLRRGGEVIGALSARSSRRGAYDDGDVELLERFAVVVANALERADLYARTAELSRRLVELHRVGRDLSQLRDLGPLARGLSEEVVKVIGAASAGVYLDTGDGRLEFAAGSDADAAPELRTLYRQALPGRLQLDLATPLEIADSAQLPPDARALVEAEGYRALVAQPLRAVDAPVGVLFAAWSEPHRTTDEERQLLGILADIGSNAIRSVRLYRELDDAYVSTAAALTATIEARDHYREDHQRRVAADVLALGERLGLSEQTQRDLRYAALFHALGKIGVPASVLSKEGPLTSEERDLVREHPLLGARVLEAIPFLRGVVPIVKHANERWDGSGYPARLRGNDIPYGARILQIAISYEAMIADRPYRAALPVEAAVGELRALAGVRYDPVLVIEFTAMVEARGVIAAAEHQVDTTTRELAVLAQITPEFHNLLDVQQLLDRILSILARTLPGASLLILLEEEGTRDLVVRAAGGARRDLEGPMRMPPGTGLSGWVMRQREPILVDDVRADPRYVGDSTVRSELIVPLISNARPIGVLAVSHPVVGAFAARDLALLQTVGAQIAAAIDVAALHERLKRAANTDALTGIHNYGYFYQRLEEEVARAERRGTPFSVAFFDIDGLKRVNDAHGHTAGDAVLRTLGRLIESHVRTEDVPARYGGDEFAIVMPDTLPEVAERVVARLMELLDRTGVELDGGARLDMPTRSWGVAAYPADGRTARELVEFADSRAYERKRSRP